MAGGKAWTPEHTLHLDGLLKREPRGLPVPDGDGRARLCVLDECLAAIGKARPEVETDIHICRLTCEMLEGAWWARARRSERVLDDLGCGCELCRHLPVPPQRSLDEYAWRQSVGLPLTVKTWPFRPELDSVLTGGWVWTRKMNDSDRDIGQRFRFEDDILVFHEYKRVVASLDVPALTNRVLSSLAKTPDVNGARALVSGLFASHKRSTDEHWLQLHAAGQIRLPQVTPLDGTSYALLQLMDSLFWHVSPDTDLWREEHLASLLLCRVLDDMADVRADALTGEINNFWLSAMPTHDKALLAACAMVLVMYGCMPEAHGHLWNTWLMTTTIVWMGLTGRHAVWFDGIRDGLPPVDDCALCALCPNSCAGILSSGVTLEFRAPAKVAELTPRCAELSMRCRAYCTAAWPIFHEALKAFEAIHGSWVGDVDTAWDILRRTYLQAIIACTEDPSQALRIQADAGAVGAELFHALHEPTTWKENTALLAYMFGCAHPHFLWNSVGYVPSAISGDWLDG